MTSRSPLDILADRARARRNDPPRRLNRIASTASLQSVGSILGAFRSGPAIGPVSSRNSVESFSSSSSSSSSLSSMPANSTTLSPSIPSTLSPSIPTTLSPPTLSPSIPASLSTSPIPAPTPLSPSASFAPSTIKSTTFAKPTSSSLDFNALRKKALSHTLSLDEHVTLGILYHERGDLRESSYHWQHASFAGDPTAMLLYGLALRHGWGIRKNPGEAFKWLRQAVGPILNLSSNAPADPILSPEARTEFLGRVDSFISSASPHITKSQLALAIYEVGMSYLHAWGVEKDEDLALRHFELSGCLGDPDALSEAARLWTKSGPKTHYDYSYLSNLPKAATWSHRKKDYQRAALLYRLAEERGASNVSNSWIYKDKYMLYKDVKLG